MAAALALVGVVRTALELPCSILALAAQHARSSWCSRRERAGYNGNQREDRVAAGTRGWGEVEYLSGYPTAH